VVTALLSAVPLLCILAAFVYAAVIGAALFRSRGLVSSLGVASTLAGLAVGRFLDRFLTLPRELDDWVNYRGPVNVQVSTKGERFLAVLSVEVALLFLFAAAISFLAVALIRRDAAGRARGAPSDPFVPLAALFACAICITARSKLSIGVAFLLARAHLL
jgi:hypothetical protein